MKPSCRLLKSSDIPGGYDLYYAEEHDGVMYLAAPTDVFRTEPKDIPYSWFPVLRLNSDSLQQLCDELHAAGFRPASRVPSEEPSGLSE